MQAIPIVIWIIVMVFAVISNANKAKTPYANEKAVKEQAKEIAATKVINPRPQPVKAEKARQVFAKPTAEKTHEHKGEVAEAVLLEDRKNDWLARQIREESRIGRRPYN